MAAAGGQLAATESLDTSYNLTVEVTPSTAWVHSFRNSAQGNNAEETGAFTEFDIRYNSSVAGLIVRFGGKRRAGAIPGGLQAEADRRCGVTPAK